MGSILNIIVVSRPSQHLHCKELSVFFLWNMGGEVVRKTQNELASLCLPGNSEAVTVSSFLCACLCVINGDMCD